MRYEEKHRDCLGDNCGLMARQKGAIHKERKLVETNGGGLNGDRRSNTGSGSCGNGVSWMKLGN